MQDRVPLYPGRVKLTPVSGQENTYDMVRADEPTQEGTPLSKATFLKDDTAAIYGLGADAVPDDVFVALAHTKGKYLYRILVCFTDGTPVSGVVVSGISPIFGDTAKTNSQGIVFAASDSSDITVSVTDYIGIINGSATIQATSASVVNEGVLELEKDTGPVLILASCVQYVYPGAASIDVCTVGGGAHGADGGNGGVSHGSGGGGGYVTNTLNVQIASSKLKFEIGAQSGTTNVYAVDEITGEDTLISSAAGATDRIGNGNGGVGGSAGTAGEASTISLFNDPSLGLAGGGGGGGGGSGPGGAPKGATGGGGSANAPAGSAPGGGGGGGYTYRGGGAGAPGGAYVRVNF